MYTISFTCTCGRKWKELISKEIIDMFGTKAFCTCTCKVQMTVTAKVEEDFQPTEKMAIPVISALTPPLKINEIFLENFVSNLFEMCKRLKHFEYSIFSKNGETFFMTEHKTLYSWVKDFMFENYF